MKNYCDICFICNDTEYCHLCNQSEIVPNLKSVLIISLIMWGAMASFDDILRCEEKWRLYNEQTTKQ